MEDHAIDVDEGVIIQRVTKIFDKKITVCFGLCCSSSAWCNLSYEKLKNKNKDHTKRKL